jgi:hypothetical protein
MHGNHLVPFSLAALVSLTSISNAAFAQEKSTSPRRDFGKRMIEKPLEQTLAPSAATFEKASADGAGKSDFVNPKVAPGQVIWHSSFIEACTSAKTSGKPVFLFQMMGKLDDRFC